MNTLQLTETQLAYFAGLIDGEASLESQKQGQRRGATPRYVLRISFTLATAEPLVTIAQWLNIEPPKMYPATDEKRSPRYRLHIPKNTAVPLLAMCMPYLILKRESAKLVLAIEAVRAANSPDRRHFGSSKLGRMPTFAVEQMEVLHQQLRALKSNKRGMQYRINGGPL